MTQHLRLFERRLRERWPGLPFVAVIERGGQHGRLHVHIAVDRRLPHKTLWRTWGHGYVWVGNDRKQKGRLPARQMARYLAKYISKQLGGELEDSEKERATGAHRYYVPRGFLDLCLRRRFRLADDAFRWLSSYYGEPDAGGYWESEDCHGVLGWWLAYPDEAIRRWFAWDGGNSGSAVP